MSNEMTLRSKALSPAKMTAIQHWIAQPEQYYATLSTTTPSKMIEADTPTLWDIRAQLGHAAAVAVLVMVFTHTARLVNLDKDNNLTKAQIGEAANDILELHGHLKVEEIKYALKRGLRTQKIYGRIDYNVIMNWIGEYDAERTEEAMRISDQEAAVMQNEHVESPDAVGFDQYLADLRVRASTDKKAAEILDSIENPPPQHLSLLTSEQRAQNDHEFKLWRLKYQLGKQ